MKVLKCGGCGAPFNEVPEDTAVQCEFCGAVNEPTILQRPRSPSGELPAVQIVIGHELPQVARQALPSDPRLNAGGRSASGRFRTSIWRPT